MSSSLLPMLQPQSNVQGSGTFMSSMLMKGAPPAVEHQVTLANWRTAPYNRWAFQHVREIIPTAEISCGGGPTRDLSWIDGEAALADLAFISETGGTKSVETQLVDSFTDAIVVLKSGQSVFEWAAPTCDIALPHVVFSVSKSISSALAGVLVEEGALDENAKIEHFIPETSRSAYGDATVRDLLDMRISVDFSEDYLDTTGAFARYRSSTGWNPPIANIPPEGLRHFLLSLEKGPGAHGDAFTYLSINTDMLGWVLERAGAARFADMLSDRIWQHIGAERDAYVTVDTLGAPRAAGGICIPVRDLARFGEMIRTDGAVGGRQVVPAAWINDIRTNGDREAWLASDMLRLFPDGRYRSQWYQVGDPNGCFCAAGIHGQWLFIDPQTEVVIAKVSAHPEPLDDPTDFNLIRMYSAISLALG